MINKWQERYKAILFGARAAFADWVRDYVVRGKEGVMRTGYL
jgi:hypothetical protein